MAHYSVQKIKDIEWLKSFFREDTDMSMNWLLLSTSGVHGTYHTLEDVENGEATSITVLVVQPRIVCIRYGGIEVTPDDVPWLGETVAKSLEGIRKSQAGNLLPEG